MQRPWLPPFPQNPYPDLPVYATPEGYFVFDDSEVDYSTTSDAPPLPGDPPPGGTNPPPVNPPPTSRTDCTDCPVLHIEMEWNYETSNWVKQITLDTIPGLDYRIERSTDLITWTTNEEFVAEGTNFVFFGDMQDGMEFFRAVQGDPSLRFPDWYPRVEQFMFFYVWSAVPGTYHLELYADGALIHETTQPIPADGNFGVLDSNYDPAYWPYTGYYDVSEWVLDVTVSPTAGLTDSAAAPKRKRVVKRGVLPNGQPAIGITVQQFGVIPNAASHQAQDDLDNYMLNYFLAQFCGTAQVNLSGAGLNENIDPTGVPKIYDNAGWALLRSMILRTNNATPITYMHYFGHGWSDSLNGKITVNMMNASKGLQTNLMRVVMLDGCKTGAGGGTLFKALVGQDKPLTRTAAAAKGVIPVYAAGWTKVKQAGYTLNGELYDPHFNFWVDYYNWLVMPNLSGNFMNTYDESFQFARHPDGMGVDPRMIDNPEAAGFFAAGCIQCYFDE